MIVPTFAANQWPCDAFYERLAEEVDFTVGLPGRERHEAIVRQEMLVAWLNYSIPAGNA